MPSPAPADATEIANLMVTWSAYILAGFTLVLTIFTLIFLVAGFLGIRELKSIRQAGKDWRRKAEAQLVEVGRLVEQTRGEMEGIDSRLTTLIEVSYLVNQGEAAYRDGEYEKAVEFLGRAATLEPKNERVLYRLGRSLTNLGDDMAAPLRLQDAREFGLAGGTPERGLAFAYRYTRPTQALQYARQAVESGETDPRNLNCLGLVLRDSGDIDGARRAHESAAEHDRDSITTPFYLALLEAHRGALQRALAESQEALYRLERQERRGKVNPMWAELIRWSDQVLRGQYELADELVPSILRNCRSRRRAEELRGHMDFLLRALGRESMLDRFVGPIERRWPDIGREAVTSRAPPLAGNAPNL